MFIELTLASRTHPNPHTDKIYVSVHNILWLRPFISQRAKRDEKGRPLPWNAERTDIEHFPAVAIGYGPSSEDDSGEIIVVESLDVIKARLMEAARVR